MIDLNIVSIGILLISAWYGLYKGLVQIFFLFASLILGSLIASKFYIYGTNFLPNSDWSLLFSFAILFFISSFIILTIGKLLAKFIEKIFLKPIDKFLGMLLAIFLGALFIGILYQGIKNFSPKYFKKLKLDDYSVVNYIYDFDTKIYSFTPKFIKNKLEKISSKK
ncbi:CvpA family protein [bacterium]